MDSLIGAGNLIGAGGKQVDVSHLRDKTVLLYFSASWCPPCRGFTPVLSQFYQKHHANKNFEIVFCSWDQTADQFQQYYSKQPWLALRWESGLGEKLGRAYGINSIPTLLVMDGNTKEIINRSGRNAVVQDPEALQFPWKGVDFPMFPMNTKLIMGCGALILGLVFLVFKPF